MEIRPEQGVDDLRFFSSIDDVVGLIGEPSQKRESDGWAILDFGIFGLSTVFNDEGLVGVSVENQDIRLWGEQIGNRNRKDISQIIEENKFEAIPVIDRSEVTRLIVADAGLEFFFDGDILEAIHVQPPNWQAEQEEPSDE